MSEYQDSSLFSNLPGIDAVVAASPSREIRQIASKVPRGVYLGTSSWSYEGWKGIVYSPLSVGKIGNAGLKAYGQYPLFKTVGLDRNYYRSYTQQELVTLSNLVPDEFRFLVKIPRDVCDPYKRNERGKPIACNPLFLNETLAIESVESLCLGLKEKLGVALFQLSGFLDEEVNTPEKRKMEAERISEFFFKIYDVIGQSTTLALEIRNSQLLTPRLMYGLRESKVRPVISLHPRLPNILRQVDALRFYEVGQHRSEKPSDWSIGGTLIIRWMLPSNMSYREANKAWEPFDRLKSQDTLTRIAIANLIKRAIDSNQNAYFIANNKAEGCAPLTVEGVAQSLIQINSRQKMEL